MSDARNVNKNGTGLGNSIFDYEAWLNSEGKNLFDIEVEALIELLPSLPFPWLEIGPGHGSFVIALASVNNKRFTEILPEYKKIHSISAFSGEDNTIFKRDSLGTVYLISSTLFDSSLFNTIKEAYPVLKPGGKLVLGMVFKDSPWGQYFYQEKLAGHPVFKHALFYKCNEIAGFTLQAGFSGERIISTLFQKPGKIFHNEAPKDGYYLDAGFVIIVAEKVV